MSNKPIDFNDLLKKVNKPKVGEKELSIWGGSCTEDEILSLLNWSQVQYMPFRIWEYVNGIKFEESTLPDDAKLLERGRLFGDNGDLSLRRDGDSFFWHFIGHKNVEEPDVGNPENFWESDHEAKFHKNEETALLWGERQKEQALWFDDQMAWAKLDYPAEHSGRTEIIYHTYSRNGQVEFVRLLKLEKYNG